MYDASDKFNMINDIFNLNEANLNDKFKSIVTFVNTI